MYNEAPTKQLKSYFVGVFEFITKAKEYILSNWTATKLRLKHKEGVKGSSTEGHVSHVLSSPDILSANHR